jgi:hypothetical protein
MENLPQTPSARQSVDPRFKKYSGHRIPTFRSSWETAYAGALDRSPNVRSWASEPFSITYYNPIKKKNTLYWPDFVVEFTNSFVMIVEIKPLKEALLEKARTLYDRAMVMQNAAKWQAMQAFCKTQGWGFKVYTERELAGLLTKRSTNKPKTARSTVKPRGTRGTRK